MPKFKELPAEERRKAFSFNFLAFFFGPIYYAIKGMWKRVWHCFWSAQWW